MPDFYCAPADLYGFGLPRGAVPNSGRLLAAVSVSANTLTLDVHGFADDDVFTLRAQAGGVLPAPLVEGTSYYAKVIDDARFQTCATAGGAVIDITAAGDAERVLVIAPLPVLSWIRFASRVIDDCLPAHVVPLVKLDATGKAPSDDGYDATTAAYPDIIVITCAEIAAGKGLGFGGSSSKTLTKAIDDAQKRIARWATGIPVRGGATGQTPANLATSASVPYRDARGWNRFGGT